MFLFRNLDLSQSLNSRASWTQVDAPDGTSALCIVQSDKVSSTSTVGFPLESNTSLQCTLLIVYAIINFYIK